MAWTYQITDSVPWLNSDTNPTIISNTWCVYNYLHPLGFTIESICGIIGNMRSESYLNPGQWELGHGGSTSYGWGLIQWTPGTSLTNYISGNWYDGDVQLDLVVREINQSGSVAGRWIPTSAYPYSGAQFKALTSISESTKAYFYERERGTWSDTRITYANQSYTILTGEPPGPDPPTPPTPGDFDVIFYGGAKKRKNDWNIRGNRIWK